MVHSRRGLIRAGAIAVPTLVCTMFSAGAHASAVTPSNHALVERDGLDEIIRHQPLCACPRCSASDPAAEHLT